MFLIEETLMMVGTFKDRARGCEGRVRCISRCRGEEWCWGMLFFALGYRK